MQEQERTQINYRPILGYRPEYGYIVPSRKEIGLLADKYPTELSDAMSISAVSLLESALETKQANAALIAELGDFLSSDLAGPWSLAEYLKSRQNKNRQVKREFEDWHRENLEGSIQAEGIILFLDLDEELVNVIEFAQDAFFGGKSVDSTSLEELKAEETVRYEEMAAAARIGNTPDPLPLAYEAQLKQIIKDRVETIQGFQKKVVGALCQTTNDALGGNIQGVVEDLSQGSQHLDALKLMATAKFRRDATHGRSVYNRKDNMGASMRKGIQKQILALRQVRLNEVAALIKWMETLDDSSPTAILANNLLDSMEDVDTGLDAAILDLTKLDQLESMTWEDIAKQLYKKKTVRQIHSVSDNMSKLFSFDNTNPQKEVRRFIQNQGLESKGKLTTTV